MGVVLPLERPAAVEPPRPDTSDLKDALARLASGLTLISCWHEGRPCGLVATSLIGLSVEPPRLLFSVRHEASSHDALLRADGYTATILSSDNAAEADSFSSRAKSAARFSSRAWRLDDPFAPRFEGGLASFDLRTEHRIGAESHTIFIAEVTAVSTRPGSPLIYFERSIAALGG
jgi:flavin reductase